MHPLISVIIPVFNVEEYLDKCVESIISQTYENLEIILVDDGSTDCCSIKCNEWKKKDNRIRVIHKKNGGLSDARNRGLEIATGDYIVFVDSDDYIDLTMIETLCSLLENNGADMSMCSYRTVDEKGNDIPLDTFVDKGVIDKKEFFNKLSCFGWWFYVIVWAKMYKKEIFDGIKFPVGKINEDSFVMHHIANKCNKIAVTDEQLYNYVQRDNSIMRNTFSAKNLADFEALYDRYKFFKSNGYDELIPNLQEIVSDKYRDILPTIQLKNFEEYKRYKKVIKLIKEMADCDKEKYPFIHHIYSLPHFLYRYCYYNAQKRIGTLNKKDLIKVCIPKIFYVFRFAIIKKNDQAYLEKKIGLDKYKNECKGKDFVLVNSPSHGNLGDQAIIETEIQYIKGIGKSFIEIPAKSLWYNENLYEQYTSKDSTIIIPGGGSLGELWPSEEFAIRRVIETFKNNKIIVFPQTATFSENLPEDIVFMNDSLNVYKSHKDILFFVRDKKSLDFFEKKEIKANFVPDIVTSYKYNSSQKNRDGILLCFRSDIEKVLDESEIDVVISTINKKYPDSNIAFTDTVIDGQIDISKRADIVKSKLDEFAQSKLVVTDRLHGMIFAAITSTPCIAFGNSNGKVEGVYKWICDNKYVRFVKTMDDFDTAIKGLDLNSKYSYNYDEITKDFELLKESIK